MEFRDLKAQYQENKTEIDSAIQEVLRDANFISGKQVAELEKQLAQYVGVKHCITCANGTDALSLMMMAWDIKEGDVVFVPDFTFFSSGEIVSFEGATPVFVDVDRDTFNIDTDKLEKAIKKTIADKKYTPRAIVAVDLFGLPANYPEIERIAKEYGLKVLEDGAQGFGGRIGDRIACSFGDASITSFFPAKPLGCYGDGGAVFTNDDGVAKLLKSFRVHGKGDNKYDNVRIGMNSRLDTIQAAVLKAKLQAFIAYELQNVNKVFHLYNEQLKDIAEVPLIPKGYYSSFAQYTIKLKSKEQRDELQIKLKEHGIPSQIYYVKPMHKQGAFSYLEFDEKDFEVTNELCDIVLSLPMHPYMNESDVEGIARTIKEVLGYN